MVPFPRLLGWNLCFGVQAGFSRLVNPALRSSAAGEMPTLVPGPRGEPLDGTGVYLPLRDSQTG